jgi:hypothetical protein
MALERDMVEGLNASQPRGAHCNATTALTMGYGLCYNTDYGTATSAAAERNNEVELPSTSNNYDFAGVLAANYAANAAGQTVRFYEPGSVCQIYVDASVTLGDYVTCIAGGPNAGKFSGTYKGYGMPGRGTAKVLQTRTGAGLVWARLLDGEESGLLQVSTPANGDVVANDPMIGGTTVWAAAALTENAIGGLSDGNFVGQRKYFVAPAQIDDTHDVVITVKSGYLIDNSDTTSPPSWEPLNTIAFDAAGEKALLEWDGADWQLLYAVGAVPAATS